MVVTSIRGSLQIGLPDFRRSDLIPERPGGDISLGTKTSCPNELVRLSCSDRVFVVDEQVRHIRASSVHVSSAIGPIQHNVFRFWVRTQDKTQDPARPGLGGELGAEASTANGCDCSQ